MKLCLAAIAFLMMSLAHASEVKLEGKDPEGQPCFLTIENWDPTETSWYNVKLQVRSHWQKSDHPSLVATQSYTPNSLYGKNKVTRDQIAVDHNMAAVDPANILNYSFQSAVDGLFQGFCRFK